MDVSEEENNETPDGEPTPESQSKQFDKILDLIGNSTRRMILKKLARFPEEGMYPGDLAQHLKISKQGVLKHLEQLWENDLVEYYEYELENPRGPKPIYYRLTPRGRNLLAILEQYNSPEEITQAREKLDQILDNTEVPPEIKCIADLERQMLDIDEQLSGVDAKKQVLLQKRYEIQRGIQQASDELLQTRFKELLEGGKITLNELSTEREILHAFFEDPISAFLRGFDLDEIFNSVFQDQTFNQRAEWENRILRLLTEKEKKERRFFFFPFEF
jgi:predicted transcriptional regulator